MANKGPLMRLRAQHKETRKNHTVGTAWEKPFKTDGVLQPLGFKPVVEPNEAYAEMSLVDAVQSGEYFFTFWPIEDKEDDF